MKGLQTPRVSLQRITPNNPVAHPAVAPRSARPIPRLGELLVSSGWLSDRQLHHLLELQQHRARPLGALAEDVYLVPAHVIAECWASQHAQLAAVDLEDHPVDPSALALLDRRRAWQFQLLPLGRTNQGTLLLATTAWHLLKALAFAHRAMGGNIALLVADPKQLEQHLDRHYPWPAAASHPVLR